MPSIQYWISLTVLIPFVGGLITLYFNYYGMDTKQRSKHPRKVLVVAMIYVLFSCYVIAQQNFNNDLKNQKLESDIEREIEYSKETHDQTNRILSFIKNK